ncbi:T9SS type A sorting domain-containing protein [Pontibacter sp. BT310]|uniref:T9SS type A sorting domain-containing protein n=1 Tax=Pontibacter populi TaxID=890055 RepID=A0ABS6X711_9BACT|nr:MULTISPECIES: T9SS type A sorting domain-containing protein [Pontibacter]MBJ6116940.1 T9SS type A sorting domain-containing protein [Pontibacter sp. BT310]MBR0569364.1 T9SS type A sorting domain-containing protein [Microvirga sp. STS03]MBW3363793.1 T9SS type A sorting domain-containing protein [Pontibacter populi]
MTHGLARRLAFITQPSNVETGATITPAPRVAIQDQFGNTVAGASNAVTLAIGNNPSSGTLATGTSATANGVVTFSGYSIDRAGTGYTLTASGSGLTSVTSSAFNVNSKVPTLATLPATCITQGAGDLTLTVSGTNFERNSIVRVDGFSRTTTYISSTQLQVLILAADLALSGNRIITVLNPAPPANNISNPQTLVVNPAMRAATIIGEREVCAGKDVLYEAPSGFTNYTWSVTQGAGVLEPTNNPAIVRFEPTVPVSGKVTISVTATNACNSTSTASFDVTVLPTPIAVIAYDSPAICAGTSQILSVASAPAGDTYTYQWFKGTTVGGATSPIGTNSPSLSVTEAGVYTVTVTGLNKCPRTSDPVEITVDPLPVATITTSGPTTFCEGGQVTLTAEGGDTFLWSNGSTNKSITVDASGTYTVQVTDGNSCTSEPSAPVTVTENPLPVATITPSGPTTFCQGGSVTLKASAGDSWLWSNGATTQSITVSAGGSFTVIVTDANGCTSAASAPVNVVVNPLPVATITAGGPTTFCQGGSVTLTASAGSSWLWSNGATSQSITVDASGTFTVQVTDGNSCISASSEPVTVTVNPLPTVSITPTGPLQFCEGNSVVLVPTALPTGDTFTYAWFNAADNSEVETTKDYVATTSGDYYLVVTNQNGCKQTSQTLTVIVAELPTEANITLEGASTFCQGGSLKLSANKSPDTDNPYTYKWFKNDVEIPNETSETYIANESGDYQVEVTNLVEDCSKLSAKVKVTVLPQPVATVTSSSEQKCLGAGNTTVFTVTGDFSGGTAQWLTSNPVFVISNPVYDASTGKATATITASGTGTSTITLRTTNNAASCSTANSAVTLTVNPLPSATITAGGPTTFCQDGSVVLSAPQGAGYTYQWFRDGAAITTAGTGQQYTAVQSGGYTVEVTNSATGCVVTTPTATNVTVNPQPTAAITGTDQAKCIGAGNSTSFTVSGTFSGGTAQWISSNTSFQIQNPVYNTTTGQATATIVATGTGAATITLRTTNSVSACNTAESTTTLTVDPLPSTTITAGGPTTFCQGGFVVLSAPQGDYSYQWFRNGTAITTDGTAKDYTASAAGNYTVRVTNNTTTCVATTATATTVTVNPQPVVSAASASPAAKCVGTGNVTVFDLTGSVANGTPQWTVVGTTGGATVSNVSSPNTTGTQVTVAGVGTVTMRLSSSSSVASCATASRDVTLTVHPMPIANAGPDQSVCQAASGVTFINRQGSGSGVGNGTSLDVKWTLKSKDSTIGTVGIGYDWLYAERVDITGFGNVTLTMTVTTNGCSTSDDVVYTVKPTPVITPIASKTYCNGATGEAITFASSVAGSTISWTSSANVGFGTNGTGNIPTYTATNTGSNPVTTTVTVNATANGCSATQQSFTITVNPTPKLSSTLTPAAVCSRSAFNYSATSATANTTFSWSRAAVSGISNPAVSNVAGNVINETLINTTTSAVNVVYAVQMTANGCTNTQNVTVSVNPNPVVSFTGTLASTSEFYTGQGAITLAASPAGGTFSGLGVSGTTFNPCTAGVGTHTITYTRVQGSCTSTVSKTVTVKESKYTVVVVADPFPVCRGQNTDYTAYVYRDIDRVVYPYMTNAAGQPLNAQGQVVADNEEPAPNPEYIANYVPANTPAIIKQYAYRYFEAKVIMGSGALVNGADGMDKGANSFTYGWTRSDSRGGTIGNDARTKGFAGLSATDWVGVWVTPKNANTICGSGIGALSSRIYFSEPQGYSMTLSSVPAWCFNPNDQSNVTLTATLGNFVGGWETANVTVRWYLKRSGVADILLATTNGVSGTTISITKPRSTFQNGDQVYVEFTSDIDTVTNPKCGSDPETSQAITIRIDQNVAITANLAATPAQCEAGSVTLSVTATGSNLQYAWYKEGSATPLTNTGRITNATTNAITISNLALSDAGKYYVTVSNSSTSVCSSTVTSNTTELIVNPLTRLASQPQGLTVCPGSPASFSVTATGTNLTYQWFKGATAIPGASAATYTIPSVVATDAGNYTVRVTGTCGVLTSSVATLIVNEPVVASPNLVETTQCEGSTVQMSVIATGTGLSYEWFKNNQSIGNNSNSLTINNALAANHNGVYHVIVKGTCNTTGVKVDMGTLTLEPRAVAVGEIFATHKTDPPRPITPTDPVKIGETAVFTVDNDFADNGENVEYLWYVRPAGADESAWALAQRSTSNVYERVAQNDDPYEVKVVINILGTTAKECYFANTIVALYQGTITPLPVELMYFKATRRENNAVLTWATAMEKNNEGFEVQVSQDGVNYRQLQFVPTKNGNTSIKQTYEFVDKENGKFGTRYYRLRQLDSDGQYAYYGPQMVIFGDVVNSVFVYPNPFERDVKLDVDSEKDATMEVTLTDLMGKKLMTKSINVAKGRSSAVLDLGEGLPAGIYIVTTRLNGITTNFKLMKK